jgi:hypothetical protein
MASSGTAMAAQMPRLFSPVLYSKEARLVWSMVFFDFYGDEFSENFCVFFFAPEVALAYGIKAECFFAETHHLLIAAHGMVDRVAANDLSVDENKELIFELLFDDGVYFVLQRKRNREAVLLNVIFIEPHIYLGGEGGFVIIATRVELFAERSEKLFAEIGFVGQAHRGAVLIGEPLGHVRFAVKGDGYVLHLTKVVRIFYLNIITTSIEYL